MIGSQSSAKIPNGILKITKDQVNPALWTEKKKTAFARVIHWYLFLKHNHESSCVLLFYKPKTKISLGDFGKMSNVISLLGTWDGGPKWKTNVLGKEIVESAVYYIPSVEVFRGKLRTDRGTPAFSTVVLLIPVLPVSSICEAVSGLSFQNQRTIIRSVIQPQLEQALAACLAMGKDTLLLEGSNVESAFSLGN